jgi:predicted Zn-dependent peptidase
MLYEVRVDALSNGMLYYYLPVEDTTTNISGSGFLAGSSYDPLQKKGLAHAVEHIRCRISRKYPDPHDLELQLKRYLGGHESGAWNIRTDLMSVLYGHGNLLTRKAMYAVFDIMASFVHPGQAILDELGMRNVEIPAVKNEYYQYGDDHPPAVIDGLLYSQLYTTNPAHWRVDGLFEHVHSFTIEDAKRFVRRYYVPNNAFMIMLGPKYTVVREFAERYFGDWKAPKSVPVLDYDRNDDVPVLSGIRRAYEYRNIKQYHFGMAWPTETYHTPDAEAIDVLANILETRAWRLREGNIDPDAGAYRASFGAVRNMTHGMIWFWFATISRKYVATAENIILEEIASLSEKLPSQKEFDVAIANLLTEYREAFKTTPDMLAELVIEGAANGDPELKGVREFRDRLRRVTRHKVREMARKYLTPHAYVRVVVGRTPA